MTKTHAELNIEFLAAALDCSKQLQQHTDFLEELKNIINGEMRTIENKELSRHAWAAYKYVLCLIKQFQAEQKVSDAQTS